MEKTFCEHSKDGIPGSNLFCDHLHPTPNGYYLMARTFFAEIEKMEKSAKSNPENLPSSPLYVTKLDWEMGYIRLFRLKNQWPFPEKDVNYADYKPIGDINTKTIAYNFVYKNFNWVKSHFDLAEQYRETAPLQSCRELLAVTAMYPERIEPSYKLIDCYEQTEQWQLLQNACENALKIATRKGTLYYRLAVAQYKTGKIKEAINTIQNAIVAPENNAEQRSQMEMVLAEFLIGIHRNKDAIMVIENLLKVNPDFKPAENLLKRIKS